MKSKTVFILSKDMYEKFRYRFRSSYLSTRECNEEEQGRNAADSYLLKPYLVKVVDSRPARSAGRLKKKLLQNPWIFL